MKHHSFQELVSRIVHLSTRDKKPIQISFSGQTAYTNTQLVNIPTLPSGTILSPHEFSIWMGYVIHEGPGHQTHTDLNLYSSACQIRNNPKFSYILNLLEDIRIENEDIKKYPGDRKYLDSVHNFVDSKIPISLTQNPDIMGLIYKQLYVKHRNLDTHIIQGTLDPETSKLIAKVDFCQSTQDCIHLADEIFNYLIKKQQEEKENKQEQENEKENSQENSQEKDNQSENQDKQTQENGSPGNPQEALGSRDEDGVGSSQETQSQSNYSGIQRNQGKSQESPNPTDFDFSDSQVNSWQEITEIKNIIREIKNQIEKEKNLSSQIPDQDLRKKSIFPPQNILNDRIYIPSEENLTNYTHARNSCSSQILALKKMFRIYLQAQTKKSQIRGLEEGKLDSQRLHIVSTGSSLIFKDTSHKLLPETAIELMIDMSGSMNPTLARTSAIILAEALSSIPQIKLSISGFTTNSRSSSYYDDYIPPPNTGRINGMDILQFKNFSEPYSKAKAKLGAIKSSGRTPLGDAYGKALEHIIPRPETRKIIFLITDGKPEFSHGKNHSDFLLMKKIHSTCKKFQIQTLGLGIGTNTKFLDNYFDKSINISEIQNLPKNLLEALKSFI